VDRPDRVIVWAAVMVARRPADRPAEQPRRETPQEILDRRFASGEIDADAFTQARPRLAGREVASP
jgi:putative membrane protein